MPNRLGQEVGLLGIHLRDDGVPRVNRQGLPWVLAMLVALLVGCSACGVAVETATPSPTSIPAPTKTWSPEQAGWPYPSPIAWE
jgi:hypothetical protein